MKLFNFFNRRKENGTSKVNDHSDMPDHYKGIITPEEYTAILRVAIQYHSDNGLKIVRIEKGEIVVEVNEEEQHRYLDNLVRILSSAPKDQWPRVITEHFNKLKDHRPAYNYLFKDFEYAAQFLRVLIKGKDYDKDQFICRSDFPETNTFLVIEFEQQFRYLTDKNIAEWGRSRDQLFSIAISNTPGEEVSVKEYQYCGKFPVYIFFSGDYSSSLMLDLAQRAAFAIGAYGSLIAIPAKGTAFAHPIESGDIMELVETLAPTIDKFYREDPGNITTNFYWRYGDEIQLFPVIQDDQGVKIRLPQDLLELFT